MALPACRAGWLASAALLAGGAGIPARADTLREALVMAYQTNPQLEAARAQQRAVDENVPIARASGLPNASGSATYSEFVKRSEISFTNPVRSLSTSVNVSLPIYAGGQVKNSVKAAKLQVEAGKASLRGTESGVFSSIVAAYMDVIQNEAIVGLNRKNVGVLKVNLQATSDRYEIGDLTRTDVAQSQSRLALAQSQTRSAEATLAGAREAYIRLVGKAPEALQPPPPLPNLPTSPEDAVQIALDNNPDLIAAREQSKAAEKQIDVAGAGRLPNPIEVVFSPPGQRYGVCACIGGYLWIACRRVAGAAYEPVFYPTVEEAGALAARLTPFLWPPADAEQEFYFNTQAFAR